MLKENLQRVRDRIRRVALSLGRDPDEIILVCVTKTAPVETVNELIKLGISEIGESKVREAQDKFTKIIQQNIRTHMVGHLQKNKARFAVKIFDIIHSVDSFQLAEELDRQVAIRGLRSGDKLDILLQINVSGEKTKFGIEPKGVFDLIEKVSRLRNVKIKGLMTIAPIVKDPEEARPFFRRLKELREEIISKYKEIDMSYLSMGMSQDFEVAIQEGANIVRIGTAIVGTKE